MESEAAEMRAQARKCRDLARVAFVPSSREALLKIADEFDEAAERIDHGFEGGMDRLQI
jgi:uncharacterized protein Yka (UPF0111/DUF47 family)